MFLSYRLICLENQSTLKSSTWGNNTFKGHFYTDFSYVLATSIKRVNDDIIIFNHVRAVSTGAVIIIKDRQTDRQKTKD